MAPTLLPWPAAATASSTQAASQISAGVLAVALAACARQAVRTCEKSQVNRPPALVTLIALPVTTTSPTRARTSAHEPIVCVDVITRDGSRTTVAPWL